MRAMSDQPDKSARRRRPVRSFVLRTGRITAGQRRAMQDLWPQYGLSMPDQALDFTAVYGRPSQPTLEIGFGNGESLLAMAAAAPEKDFLGIEVHEPGVGHCLLGVEKAELGNVRVMRDDAVEVLQRCIADHSLGRVNLFFPDPWHKKRHHKRRIVRPDFVALIARKLVPGGIFHVATDWPNYAEHIQEVMAAATDFVALQNFPADRIETRFDQRGQRLGHENFEGAWCTRSNQ